MDFTVKVSPIILQHEDKARRSSWSGKCAQCGNEPGDKVWRVLSGTSWYKYLASFCSKQCYKDYLNWPYDDPWFLRSAQTTICLTCKKTIYSSKGHIRTCSPQCQYLWELEGNKIRRRTYKTCEMCRTIIHGKNKKYCSPACKQKAYRQRKV